MQNGGAVGADKTEEMSIGSIIRPLSREGRRLFNANRIASLQHSDTYLSIYFRPGRFRYGGDAHSLLTNTRVLRESLNANPLSENNTYLVSRVTSCNILTEVKATRGKSCRVQNYSIIAYPFILNIYRKFKGARSVLFNRWKTYPLEDYVILV